MKDTVIGKFHNGYWNIIAFKREIFPTKFTSGKTIYRLTEFGGTLDTAYDNDFATQEELVAAFRNTIG